MTLKIYDKDCYAMECDSVVTKCTKDGESYKIYLDKTVFFARGGGQPADRGTIDGIAVTDVFEDDFGVAHVTDTPFEEGKTVHCALDRQHRLDSMQQHLGQHIFSRAAELMFDAKTVAARIEEGVSHVELSKKLAPAEMAKLEKRVNDIIELNYPVSIDLYTKEEASKLGLPAKAFTHEIIRVVTIKGLDVNPCGGTHPKSTGEVKKCMITGTKEVRGVFRIYYKFGDRALNDRENSLTVMTDLQHFCGCFDRNDYMTYLNGLFAEKEHLLSETRRLKEELLEADCQNLLHKAVEKDGYKLITAVYDGRADIKPAVDRLILEHKCAVGIVTRTADTVSIVLAQTKNLNKYNMGALVREYLAAFPGKGGGGNAVAQCGVPCSDEAFEKAKELLKSLY